MTFGRGGQEKDDSCPAHQSTLITEPVSQRQLLSHETCNIVYLWVYDRGGMEGLFSARKDDDQLVNLQFFLHH